MRNKHIRSDGRVEYKETLDGRKDLGDQAGSSLVIDFDEGSTIEATLTGNITSVTLQGGVEGAVYGLILIQDVVGTRTLTGLPASFKAPGGTAPTLSTATSAKDYIQLEKHGSEYWCLEIYKDLK